jgi:hypothetical protein
MGLRKTQMENESFLNLPKIKVSDLQAGDVIAHNISLRIYTSRLNEAQTFIIRPRTVIVIVSEENQNMQGSFFSSEDKKVFSIITEGRSGFLYVNKSTADFRLIERIC